MVRVRPATAGDAPAVRRVARAAYDETYVDIVGADGVDRLLSAWYDTAALRDRLGSDEGATTYVAVECGEVVGYAGAVVADEGGERVGHLPTLYVHPDHWGAGIGTRLFDRALEHVRERGAAVMRIRVFADNDVGRGFYEDRAELVAESADDLSPLDREVETAVYEARIE